MSVLPLLVLLAPLSDAWALTLTLEGSSTPHPGITLLEYRASSPATDVMVAEIDLCAAGISVETTKASSSLQTASSWASDQGLQLAVNGDFYRTGPVQVYGDAIGQGVAWPLEQTGLDPAYSADWFYEDYGFLAFRHDEATFTHTRWVKDNLTVASGHAPGTIAPEAPSGTLSLVSGFPELVVDGQARTCVDPTDNCFPDRSDMQDRHPRTAAGLSQDGATLWMVAVDGRTSSNTGMYGSELADLMGQLGAWQAFNLDGGGSTQMWVEGSGTVNGAVSNNGGNGVRSVANHLGVRATGSGRPSHCPTEPACGTISPLGGTVDELSDCFSLFGPDIYWRDESAGDGGHLYWTNAWNTDQPANWAWWRLELEEAGEYEVEFYADPTFSVFPETRYVLVAGGVEHELLVDQGQASGWTSLGTYDFTLGGEQYLAVYDDGSGVAADQHVVADAIRLTRVDLPVDTGDTGLADTDVPVDTDVPEDTDAPEDTDVPEDTDSEDPAPLDTGDTSSPDTDTEPLYIEGGECGCATASDARLLGVLLVPLVALTRIRRSEME